MEKRNLLLVDDEPAIRLTLSAILEQNGFNVTTAADVAEALAAIQVNKYDVLLSDLNIGQPGDGFTVVSAMRRIQPKAVTIIITGFPAFESALEAIRQQVDDYVIKPAKVEELITRIREKLEGVARPPRPMQCKRAFEIVRGNRDVIIEEWLKRVEADSQLRKISLAKEKRKGYLPQFLDSLTAQVEAKQNVGPEAMYAAAMHGKDRLHNGYSIPLLVREANILENVIFEVLQQHLLEIVISYLITDMVALSKSINEQMEESIRAYIGPGLPATA